MKIKKEVNKTSKLIITCISPEGKKVTKTIYLPIGSHIDIELITRK